MEKYLLGIFCQVLIRYSTEKKACSNTEENQDIFVITFSNIIPEGMSCCQCYFPGGQHIGKYEELNQWISKAVISGFCKRVTELFNPVKEVVTKATAGSLITKPQLMSVYPGVAEIPQKRDLNHNNDIII